jgi:hypothetical protein
VCARDGGDESDRKDAEPQIASAIFVLNYEKYLSVKLIFHFFVHSSYVFFHRESQVQYLFFLQEYLVNLLDDIYYLCS